MPHLSGVLINASKWFGSRSKWIIAHHCRMDVVFCVSDMGFCVNWCCEYCLQIVLSGFGTRDQHLKLTTIMFQNIFPAIDINTVRFRTSFKRINDTSVCLLFIFSPTLFLLFHDSSSHSQVKLSSCQRIVLLNYNKDTKLIDFRHYSIRLQPVGVSRRIRKFVLSHNVPDLRNLQDVSDFVTK